MVDAFVCIIDNQKPIKTSTAPLIHGMMAAAAARGPCRTPLLVMSTTASAAQERHASVIDQSTTLRLTLLNQPWKMQGVSLDSPGTVFSALDWLLGQV